MTKTKKTNVKAVLSYDGSLLWGWQKTRAGPSVEAALEQALFHILHTPFALQAASRTDRGVHAVAQVVNWMLPPSLSDVWGHQLPKLQHSLNAVLPSSVRITSLEQAPCTFHPTLDAVGKEYHYFLCITPCQLPFHRRFSWHIPYPLDEERMRAALPLFAGRHDFSAFSNAPGAHPHCSLTHLALVPLPGSRLRFEVHGDRFLYKMVRILMGTLVDVGTHRISLERVESLLREGKRKDAGRTAPPHALFLHRVSLKTES